MSVVDHTPTPPAVLLAHHLKELRLPTCLLEYERLALECAHDGVDHVRYLLRLVELDLIDRERRLIERRIKAARFPVSKSVDAYRLADAKRRRAKPAPKPAEDV